MEPSLKWLAGFPIRIDVIYGYVGIVMIATAVIANVISTSDLLMALNVTP